MIQKCRAVYFVERVTKVIRKKFGSFGITVVIAVELTGDQDQLLLLIPREYLVLPEYLCHR